MTKKIMDVITVLIGMLGVAVAILAGLYTGIPQ